MTVDLDRVPEPFLAADGRGVVVGANASAAVLFGRPRSDLLGRPLASFFAAGDATRIATTLAAGRSGELETGLQLVPGGSMPVLLRLAAYHGETPGQVAWTCLVSDRTRRLRQEEGSRRLIGLCRLVNQVSRAAARCMTAEAMFSEICHGAVHTGGLRSAWVASVSAVGQGHRLHVVAGHDGCAGRHHGGILPLARQALGSCPATEAVRRGCEVVALELPEAGLPGEYPACEDGRAIGAVAAFPLLAEDGVRGVLVLHADDSGFFGEAECSVLREVAASVSLAVDTVAQEARRRAREAVAQEQMNRRLASLFRAVPVGIFVVVERRFVEVNEAACRMLNYTREELIGVGTRLIYPSDEEYQRVGATYYEQVRRGGSTSGETRWRRRDGGELRIELHAASIVAGDLSGGVTFAAVDITERHRSDVLLRHKQAEVEAVYEHAPNMLALVDGSGVCRRANRALLGHEGGGDGSVGVPLCDLVGCEACRLGSCATGPRPSRCGIHQVVDHCLRTGEGVERREWTCKLKRDGGLTEVTVLYSAARVMVGGEMLVLLCMTDVSKQRQLESQLRQAQKLEALGMLAGGIAHDFNNILTAKLLILESLKAEAGVSATIQEAMAEITGLSCRAADLVRQLLLFSRRKTPEFGGVDLNRMVRGMVKMLARLLGEKIGIRFTPLAGEPLVRADAGMLEQVIMNLSVNARDAMPGGGTLAIEISAESIRPDQTAAMPQRRAGDFYRMDVSDTGTGMDAYTVSRLFEPFFTTKGVGKGTGLGLATAFGIVQQHEGWIEVESAVGAGTTFRVFLPRSTPPAVEPEDGRASPAPATAAADTILLVEDEPVVRSAMARMLRATGFQVLEAANPQEALIRWEACAAVDVLLTDMVMPGGRSGLDLARELRLQRPDLRVVIMSGYSPDLLNAEPAREDIHFIAKPITLKQLLAAIRSGHRIA